MGKLGKKARKFVRKNLPAVIKNRRKFRSRLNSFKRRTSPPAPSAIMKDEVINGKSLTDPCSMRDATVGGVYGFSLFDTVVSEDEENPVYLSDSDGYLSEDPNCPCISESDELKEGNDLGQNNSIHLELLRQNEKLEILKREDPKFPKFLKEHRDDIGQLSNEEEHHSDGEDLMEKGKECSSGFWSQHSKFITSTTIDVWCWLIIEGQNISALPSLLNGYRTACHCIDGADESLFSMIPNGEVFSKILTFCLYEADGVFRSILGISASCSGDDILNIRNSSQWSTARPLIKSYLRSTVFLLNEVTDGQIAAFILSRLGASITFFVAFPHLISRLTKTLVHLWAIGDETLSVSSFILLKEMCMQLSAECYVDCLIKTYQAYLGCYNFVRAENAKHQEFLGDSIVQLYSIDVQRSYPKVLACLQKLVAILQQCFKPNHEEVLRKICSWQYVKSVEIWVQYMVLNINNIDPEPLLYLVIQIVRAVCFLFPGPRYIPLRLRYIRLLNQLSSCSGVFIPVAYLLLDIFDTKGHIKSESRQGKAICLFTTLQAPKQWLKSHDYKKECITCAIELLNKHFSQWIHHVSFPDLAVIPLTIVKRFHDNVASESIHRSVKRFIDMVEVNTELMKRKRDEVSFSPSNQALADAFSLMQKNGSAPSAR